MDTIRLTVAKNIGSLRTRQGMTQLELAERLNYSDKAVSKWERGESLPDVSVLVRLADLFGVSLDTLVREPAEQSQPVLSDSAPEKSGLRAYRRGLISWLAVLCVWLIATALFVVFALTGVMQPRHWLVFIYALPVSLIVWLVLNSVWFGGGRNYAIISALMWSVLISVFVTAFSFGSNLWLIFLLGIPGQIIILVWSGLGKAGMERLSGRLRPRARVSATQEDPEK